MGKLSDQRRLHVARVTIEFEFAFVAIPDNAGEVASHLIDQAASDLSSLHNYAMVMVHLAAPAYAMPLDGCEADHVCGLRTASGRRMKWSDAVENDKRLHAPEPSDDEVPSA